MRHLRVIAVGLALALLAGCGPAQASPSTASSQAIATATPAPTPAPTPTPAATGNPLTGEADGDYTGLRPLAITLRTLEGSAPLWGVAAADVLVAGVTEGSNATLLAMYADPARATKVGPVGPGRDLTLQLALPMNAVPVHMDKNIYAANLLNLLTYQDIDGYHIGKVSFAFDAERDAAGYNEENCWYTSGELVKAGLDAYGASLQGPNQPLFAFAKRPAPAAQDGVNLTVNFSAFDSQRFVYDDASGLYCALDSKGDPVADGDTGAGLAFTNLFVLYASSGIKDDTYTREYDLSGGDGVYLTGGGWEAIRWEKGDATAPLLLYDAKGDTLAVEPGKSFIALWGGYYGQTLQLLGADGAVQALPEKPALLESGVSDEDAAAAEEEYMRQHAIIDAQAAVEAAQLKLSEAQYLLQEAQQTPDTVDDDNAAYLQALAQQELDAANAALAALQAGAPAAEAPAEAPAGDAPAAEAPAA